MRTNQTSSFDKGYTDGVGGNAKRDSSKEYLDGYLAGIAELSKIEIENNY